MTRWGYVQQVVPYDQVLRTCRLGGEQGWELCGMVEVNLQAAVIVPGEQQVTVGYLLLFKQPVAEEQAPAPPVNRDSHAPAVEHLFTR